MALLARSCTDFQAWLFVSGLRIDIWSSRSNVSSNKPLDVAEPK